MPVESSAGLLPKAIVAALVGSVAGGTAGVWSLRHPAASVNAAAPAVSAATTLTTDDDAGPSPSTSLPKRVAPAPQPARVPTNAAAPPSADDDAHVLERARMLARRPDVTALMALREDVVLRARERGIAGSSSVKGELEELDLRLTEARTLQLKLDAEEFRKADSKPPR
jgi:hypothetical protein